MPGPNLKVRFDFSDITDAVRSSYEALKKGIVEALNDEGDKLQRETAAAASMEISEQRPPDSEPVPPRAVLAGMPVQPASQGDYEYEIGLAPSDFEYREWVTERDDRVCKICRPRDGMLYTLEELEEIHPAHPNCRCHLIDPNIEEPVMEAAAERMPWSIATALSNILEDFRAAWK